MIMRRCGDTDIETVMGREGNCSGIGCFSVLYRSRFFFSHRFQLSFSAIVYSLLSL